MADMDDEMFAEMSKTLIEGGAQGIPIITALLKAGLKPSPTLFLGLLMVAYGMVKTATSATADDFVAMAKLVAMTADEIQAQAKEKDWAKADVQARALMAELGLPKEEVH